MNAKNAGLIDSTFDRILDLLTTRQHVNPHRPIRQAVATLADITIIDAALRRRSIDPQKSIGRLRRTELVLLAKSLEQLSGQARPEISIVLEHQSEIANLVS